MNIEKMTETTSMGFVSAVSTLSGISLISVSTSNFNSDESYQPVLARLGLSGIALGIVLGLTTAYLAVNAYLSTNRD